ncbi:MAG TPA: CapA family protein [Anaerolineaceae bacterium]|nr:CapA family protein [Anaerolineaceae bacterium]HPN53455.1 CapA family protein [Anaerolineaceae bacterium]
MKLKRRLIRGALCLALLGLCGCQNKAALSITFGGDIFLARDGAPLFAQAPWNGFGAPPEGLFFANLESPLGRLEQRGDASAGYNLCAGMDQAALLTAGGVDLVSLANNHRQDCGTGEATLEALVGSGIAAAGSSLSPVYLDTAAGRVGVIAADGVSAPLDEAELVRQAGAARQNCAVLIVSLHWGEEYQSGPGAQQRALAQKLADAGVDVLWGHHPHVLQPAEWVRAADGSRKMLVLYSLGNLLADQWMLEDARRSALVTVDFKDSQIVAVSIQPIYMDRQKRQLVSPRAEDAEKIRRRLGWQE